MTASPDQETETPPVFPRGTQLTILLSVEADAQYEVCAPGGTTVLMLEAALPSKSPSRVVVPCGGYPGVIVAVGDIRPVLRRMAHEALEIHAPLIECPACDPGGLCPACVLDKERRREYWEVLDALGELPGT